MKPVIASTLLALASAGAVAQGKTPAATAPPAPAAAPAPATAGQDRADIDRQQIIGNRELPKVLYIVPWKKPLPGDLAGRPSGGILDEALAPIDRDVFRRQVQYGAQIAAPKATPDTSTAPTRP
jgi:hypothetical protein